MIIQNIQLKNSSFMQKIKESTIGRQVEPAIPATLSIKLCHETERRTDEQSQIYACLYDYQPHRP